MDDTDDAVEFPTMEFGEDADAEEPKGGRRKAAERKVKQKQKQGTFESMGLGPMVLKAIRRKGYRLPTPIQRKTIPLILQGVDVVGMARTGSGKTAAFVIPMVERLKAHAARAGARAVLLSPTRELALQTHKVVQELNRFCSLRTAVLVGGDSMEAQFAELATNPDVLVATPGRILHHLAEVDGMSLKTVEYAVLDEADRLFEMGFSEQTKQLLSMMGSQRQTLLFSATLPAQLAEFARAGLKEPEFVRLDADTKLSPQLSLAFFTVRPEDRVAALLHLVSEVLPPDALTLVFAATRHHVEFLQALLQDAGVDCAAVYGSMEQTARKTNVAKFRCQKVKLMLVTDVAARGIDIPLLDCVVNFDFPAKPKLFVHRAGRVARAGRSGTAFSLVSKEEMPYLLDLHLFLSRPLRPVPAGGQGLAEGAPASTSIYGSFPRAGLERMRESVARWVAASQQLQALERSGANAYRLYRRTRPPAAAESAKRAKKLPEAGAHPMLLAAAAGSGMRATAALAEEEAAALDFTAQLQHFRPSATVFEVAAPGGGSGAPSTSGRGGEKAGTAAMAKKRRQHQQLIAQRQRREANERAQASAAAAAGVEGVTGAAGDGSGEEDGGSGGSEDGAAAKRGVAQRAASLAAEVGDGSFAEGRFRDADFFIAPVRQDRLQEQGYELQDRGGAEHAMRSAVMDVQGDDADALTGAARRFHWDKRKRQYVQLQKDETVKLGKRVRTESGKVAEVSSSGAGLYKKWASKSRTRIAPSGAVESSAAAAADLKNRFRKGGRGWANPFKASEPMPNAGAREETKSAAQVKKERKKAERMRGRGRSSAAGRGAAHTSSGVAKRGGGGGGRGRGRGGRSGARRGRGH